MAVSEKVQLEPRRGRARRVRIASLVFALLAVITGFGLTYRFRPDLFQRVKAHYGSIVSEFLNAPDNESVRAQLIEQLVDVYRETPAGKSLALRDEQGRVVGRFRIDRADVSQIGRASDDLKARRRFQVSLSGHGEMWHETGGRVRFDGGAEVTYEIDFLIDSLTVYTYFSVAKLHSTNFKVTQVDNILAQMFSSVVDHAGEQAVAESIQPGFTIITRDSGESWLAMGRVGREFVPKPGPNEEKDKDCDTICNDVSLLQFKFRDYLGPFEMFEGDELRLTLDVSAFEGREAPGVDLLLVNEADFKRYEDLYPHGLGRGVEKLQLSPLIEHTNTRSLRFTRKGIQGRYYLIIDRTAFGRGNQSIDEYPCEVKYYGRIKRS